MAQDATIISASLNDSELKQSVDSLVQYVKDGTDKMVRTTNKAVEEMKEAIQSLNSIGSVSDGGSSKRTKQHQEETQAIKDKAMSYDRLLGTLQMMQRQERMFANKNMFAMTREELEKYAYTIKRVEELQRELNSRIGGMAYDKILKFQGVTDMREYITGLMKPNESLKRLNDDYKEWERTSKQTTQAATKDFANYSDEILKQAERIRNSETFKKTGAFQWTEGSGDVMRVFANEKKYGSIEEQLVQMQQIRINNAKELFGVEEKTTEKASDLERIREKQAKAQEEYLASRKTEAEIQAEIQKNAKAAADALSQSKRNQGNIQNLSTDFRYEATIDELKRLREAYNKLDADTKRSPFGKELKSYINGLEKSLVSLGDKMRDESLMSANIGNSYDILTKKLVRLQTVYNQLNETERNSDYGNKIADSIQRTSRAMQQIQNQKARPKNIRDVLGLDEKTLDDIAYKMQMLQRYRSGLDVNAQRGEINQVNQAYDRLKAKMDEVMAKSAQMNTINNSLTRSFNYMKNRLAFYFTVGASTSFVKQLIDIRSQYELTERSLGILVQSAEKGTQIFQQLSQMSLVSPYTLIELSNAARQLTAYGIAAKDVVDTTRRLADISAAVGAPVERIAYALGHVQSYGYLTSLQARQFANSGIPLVKELANRYSELEGRMVTTADVYDRMKKKQVEYADVMDVVNKMTDEGGRFFDFQAKQADTLKVQLANLNLAWNNMLNEMGQNSQGVLTFTIKSLKSLFASWESVSKAMYTVVAAIGLYKAQAAIVTMLIGKKAAKSYMAALALKDESAATYEAILADKNLSASQAKLLLAMNHTNAGLRQALVNMKLLTVAQANAIANSGRFGLAWRFMGAAVATAGRAIWSAIKMIGSAIYSNVWLIAATAFADLIISLTSLGKKTEEVNEAIARSSKEASESLEKFIETARKAGTISAAKSGNLSGQELEKTWTNIREEIETSSSAGKEFIAQLLEETDLSKRVSNAFDIAESIERANLKMKDFTEQIKISEDVWHGWLGEGLETDFEQYAGEVLETSVHAMFTKWISGNALVNPEDVDEAAKEMQKLAESIKESFKAENITDPNEIKEALTKIREQIIAESPKLKGAVADLFRFDFDKMMNKEFGDSFDATASLWNKVIEEIKKSSYERFSSLSDDILNESHDWTEKENAIFLKAFDKVNKDFKGMFNDTLQEMQKELESREFKARILFAFDIQKASAFQQEFKNRVTQAFGNMFYLSNIKYAPKANMELHDWAADNINVMDDLRKNLKKYHKDNSLYEASVAQSMETELKVREDLNKLFKQPITKETNKKEKDIVLDTLKEEISLVEKLQSDYEKLTKAGASSTEALDTVRNAYGSTIDLINDKLNVFGLSKLDLSMITGKNPKEQLDYFNKVKEELEKNGLGNLERIKALDAIIEKLNVKVKTYNLDMVTKGLNNELSKLDEDYELGVELDANPELGGVFTDMLGIDKSELDELPRTAKEYADVYTKSLNKYFKDNKNDIEVPNLLMLTRKDMDEYRRMFEKEEITETMFKLIQDGYKKTHDVLKKEITSTVSDWDKMLEKYAEFEHKIRRIQSDANKERKTFAMKFGTDEQKAKVSRIVMQLETEKDPNKITELRENLSELLEEISNNDDMRLQIKLSIDNKEAKEIAKTELEEFQKSADWILATGDLATMATSSLKLLIKEIENYKKKAKNLDPKDIKKLNNALNNLKKQVRSNSPFAQLANLISSAKERQEEYNDEIIETTQKIADLNIKRAESGELSKEEEEEYDNLLEKIKDLTSKREAAGKINPKEFVGGLQSIAKDAGTAGKAIGEMFAAMGDKETAEVINQVFGVIDKTLEFASIGASIGGGIGAIVGGVIGLFAGLAGAIGDAITGNSTITENVEASERAVKRLESSYKALEDQANNAYGAIVVGLQRAQVENKKLQLEELRRQLRLEESRAEKNKDKEKIASLQTQIQDLAREIKNAANDVVNDLLGISSATDGITSLVDTMINAFKNGEDAMDAFGKKWDEMIDNMVLKLLVSEYMKTAWEKVMNDLNKKQEEYLAESSQKVSEAQYFLDAIEGLDESELRRFYKDYMKTHSTAFFGNEALAWNVRYDFGSFDTSEIYEFAEKMKEQLEMYSKTLDEASIDFTKWSLEYMSTEGRDQMMNAAEILKNALGEYWTFGQDADKNLNALQQGLSSMSESTAEALTAYLNGISQQVYLHSDILMQIRDTLTSFDMDVQVATQGQILLQLQNSYQVQMSIQSILQGWSNPSGQAMRVEMI